MKKRGLGRNLNALLSHNTVTQAVSVTSTSNNTDAVPVHQATTQTVSSSEGQLRYLPIELLQRGRYQPRREISTEMVQELADSIRTQGIIQPIVVRSIAQNQYEIIAGERRWRAAQVVGLSEVPTIVKDISDEATLAVALIENIQREDLNPLEEAIALQRLADEFAMTHQQVAEAVGKSRTTVTNLLRLLSLQPEVKTFLEQRALEMGHARALLGLTGLQQTQAAKLIVEKQLSVRATEALVRQLQAPQDQKKTPVVDPDTRRLQQTLSEKLGAQITFQTTAKGKGKLIIHYNSLDELDGILTHIH
jgi:ParB family chromosome partitioning protein